MVLVPAYLEKSMACKSPANVPPAEDEVDIKGYRFTVWPGRDIANSITVLLNKFNMDMPNPGETFMVKAWYMPTTRKNMFMGFHKVNGCMMWFDRGDGGSGIHHCIPLESMAEMFRFVEPPRLSEDGEAK